MNIKELDLFVKSTCNLYELHTCCKAKFEEFIVNDDFYGFELRVNINDDDYILVNFLIDEKNKMVLFKTVYGLIKLDKWHCLPDDEHMSYLLETIDIVTKAKFGDTFVMSILR